MGGMAGQFIQREEREQLRHMNRTTREFYLRFPSSCRETQNVICIMSSMALPLQKDGVDNSFYPFWSCTKSYPVSRRKKGTITEEPSSQSLDNSAICQPKVKSIHSRCFASQADLITRPGPFLWAILLEGVRRWLYELIDSIPLRFYQWGFLCVYICYLRYGCGQREVCLVLAPEGHNSYISDSCAAKIYIHEFCLRQWHTPFNGSGCECLPTNSFLLFNPEGIIIFVPSPLRSS